MVTFIKWTAITAAAITGVSFAYAAVAAARRKVDRGLAQAEQMAEDAKRVLASTQQALTETQQTVRHLRATVS
jgi:F0F1-type ATP synthase membrane subunit b/b'